MASLFVSRVDYPLSHRLHLESDCRLSHLLKDLICPWCHPLNPSLQLGVDGAKASHNVLESIIGDGVGEKLALMFDSGIHGSSDAIKALCQCVKVWSGWAGCGFIARRQSECLFICTLKPFNVLNKN